LKERCGYGRLGARIMAHQICHWGKNLASEINEGRRVRAIIDKMADAGGRSTLVMSRRAKNSRDECRSVEARDLIEGAIEKANLPRTAIEFDKLVELARERDGTACRDLGRTSQQLAPHLPEKRGRPISEDACIHLFLLRQLGAKLGRRQNQPQPALAAKSRQGAPDRAIGGDAAGDDHGVGLADGFAKQAQARAGAINDRIDDGGLERGASVWLAQKRSVPLSRWNSG
jgi:hypothetical protein